MVSLPAENGDDEDDGTCLRVEVRMADDDHLQPTQFLNLLDRVFIEICNEIPQEVAMWCLDEAGRLADSHLFSGQVHFPQMMLHSQDGERVDVP